MTLLKKNTQLKERAQGEMNKFYLLSTISKCNTKPQIALEQSKASDDKTLVYMNENHHWAINIKHEMHVYLPIFFPTDFRYD